MCPIAFTPSPEDWIEIDEMTKDELLEYRTQVLGLLSELDAREPKSMRSPAYDDWAEEHEDLEDLLDDIQDRLDTLR